MNKIKKALILNIVLFALEVFANGWMMSGIGIHDPNGALVASKLTMFKYFTVDSNVLMGIIALIVAFEENKILKGQKDTLANWISGLKLMGTVGVTLTMLVTIFFLAPTLGLTGCFTSANFFLHLVCPLLSLVVYLGYEKQKDGPFIYTFAGLVPLIIYAFYYVGGALSHLEGGYVQKGYDWYGFFKLGINSAFVVVPLLAIITYGLSYGLWRLNKYKVN